MRKPLILPAVAALALLAGCVGNPRNGLPVHCLDEPAPGTCKGRVPGYYYDYPSDTCRVFYHGGCGGRVPFESRSDCEETCVAGRP
jgi:hypothetical protein